MHLVFWQQIRSPHQFALLNALSQHPEVSSVKLVVSQDIPADRQQMGWAAPEYENVTVYTKPSSAEVDLLVRVPPKQTHHIFSGLETDAMSTLALKSCIKHGASIAVMAEAPTHQGKDFKGLATRLKYFMLAMRYNKHISRFFAIGTNTADYYQSVGYTEEQVVRFGYYVDIPTRQPQPRFSHVYEILFVGRASAAKGMEMLIHALTNVQGNWQLNLVTEGQERSNWERLAQNLNLTSKIHFTDFEDNPSIQQRMANSDLLVIPNTGKEGWGVVVNEALLQGTPVLCTTLTGAQGIVRRAPSGGTVVPPQQADLSHALQVSIDAGPRLPKQRAETALWAQQHISGLAGAALMVKALKGASRPE